MRLGFRCWGRNCVVKVNVAPIWVGFEVCCSFGCRAGAYSQVLPDFRKGSLQSWSRAVWPMPFFLTRCLILSLWYLESKCPGIWWTVTGSVCAVLRLGYGPGMSRKLRDEVWFKIFMVGLKWNWEWSGVQKRDWHEIQLLCCSVASSPANQLVPVSSLGSSNPFTNSLSSVWTTSF